MIFALPAIRGAEPDVPDVGTLVDVSLVFLFRKLFRKRLFLNILIIIIFIQIVSYMWCVPVTAVATTYISAYRIVLIILRKIKEDKDKKNREDAESQV